MGDLTDRNETDRSAPWQVNDAPEAFVAAQLRGIAGIEITVSELTGKWKVSQNRPQADRTGVYDGLMQDGENGMADLVELYGGGTKE